VDLTGIELLISMMTPMAIIILGVFFIKERNRDVGPNISVENNNPVAAGADDLGGYVVLDISEDNKPVFRDLLIGFEEYAKLKGYKVCVSVKSNIHGKIAYRIDIDEQGITKSTCSVKKDLDDYIKEVNSDSEQRFKELPVIISEVDHERVTTTLRNRIATLEVNYQLEKRTNEFLMNLAAMFPQGAVSHTPQPIQIINRMTDMNDSRSYEVNNSTGITQGDNSSTLMEGNKINLGANHAERSEIVNKLEELLVAIRGIDIYSDAARNIENAKEELTDAQEPDVSRIKKWLEKAKSAFSMAEDGSEVLQKAKDAYEALGSSLA